MKFFCKATVLSFLAAAALALVACGGDSGASSPDNGGETGVTSVTLSASNNATVTVGETITLTATPNATPTSNQYRWTVSNAAVAQLNNSSDTTITISSNTVTLKGVKAGTVSVTVSVDGVTSNTLSVTVNAVSASEPTLQSVTISGGGEIAAMKTATLEASPTFTTTPTSDTTTYVWAIIKVDGTTASSSAYATLTPNGKTATLQANNTTNKEHTITVQVTATYNGKPKSNTATVTIAAQGETVQNKLTDLTLVPEATSLNPQADTVLTAAATYSGTVLLSYEWKIIKVDGKDVTDDTSVYATLSDGTDGRNSRAATTEHKYNTLTNTNTTVDDHVITVQLTATNTAAPTNYITKTADITVKGAKITGIAIVADKETISSDGTATLSAEVATTDDSVEYAVTWEITAVNGTAGATTEYAMLTKNADGTATLTGKNTSGAKLTVTITATATNKNADTNTEFTTKTITIARQGASAAYYPLVDEEAAYADTYLEITFDDTPTINRASSGTVCIYKKDGTPVDTIKPAAEKLYGYGVGGNANYDEINAQYQLIQVIDEKTVRIIPHHGATAQKATLLENGTEYYVLIDSGLITGTVDGKAFAGITDATAWTFKTGAAPNVSGNTLTVGKDKQFVTVQGALSYLMKSGATGDWQINIDKGTYYERIFYSGKANITMSGQGSATYGTDVEIQWANQDGGTKDASGNEIKSTLWNTGTRGRNVFYYAGGNLILENLSLVNTATRKSNEYGEHDDSATSDNALGSNQAEALLFDSTGTCAAYNCNFTSKQDTVYLSPSGGKAWFYGCKISGDVDFIWGLSNVALFEKCNIISAYDADKSKDHATYVVASHLKNSSAPHGKGFVVYNSTITTESGQTTYLARSPWGSSGTVAQVAIIDTKVTGGLASSPWYGNHVGGTDETVLGWKWYNVTSDGSAIADTYKITKAQYEAEFAGRRNILNRVYNGSAFEKDSTSYWDISSLLSRWNIAECGSKETLSGETEVTSVVYDFTALTGYTAQTSYVSSASPTTGTGDNITLSSNWKWHGSTYGLCNSGSSPWTITVPITGACTITITNSYNVDATVSLPSSTTGPTTLAANSSKEYTYTGSAGSIAFSFTSSGTFYISKIIVVYTSTGDTSGNELTETDFTIKYFTLSDDAYSASSTVSYAGAVTAQDVSTSYNTIYNTLATSWNSTNGAEFALTNSSGSYSATSTGADLFTASFVITALAGDVTVNSISAVGYQSASSGNIHLDVRSDSTKKGSTSEGNTCTLSSQSIGTTIAKGSSATISLVFALKSSATLNKAMTPNLRDVVINCTLSEDGSGAITTPTSVSVSGGASVKVGSTITLTATPNVATSSAYTWTVTNGTGTVTYDNSSTNTITLTGATAGTVTVKASVDGVGSGAYTVTVKEASATNVISLSDTPTGYAGYGYSTSPYYTGSSTITINATDSDAASKLKEYAKKKNYVIYINGIIDITEGRLPSAWNDDNVKLGQFISTNTNNAYTSWSAWRSAYAKACDATSHKTTGSYTDSGKNLTANTNDSTLDGYQTALAAAWKKQIQIVMADNTTIIGLTNESGIKGGNISISGVKNIMLRNLHLQDAFDPFPHHEYNDGWNAEYDCITIQNTNSYIWIDHCTFEDTISVGWTDFAGVEIGSVGTGGTTKAYSESTKSTYEMWQTYDGLCDIKGSTSNVTVSYCVFQNHDKTMLIGNSDSESVTASTRTITLHHNYYDDCVQRLPMARLSYIHNFNNYYGVNSDKGYDQKAAVNARYGVYINSEYNYFDSGLNTSYNSSDETAHLYYANDTGAKASSTSLTKLATSTTTPVFTVPYGYEVDSASGLKSDLESNAGAGAWTVQQ